MQQQEQRFSFTGSGSEYFRIWIVNLFLTIITLGIYSAWAKVRRMQYFYRNTWLNDASFDYHGAPTAILKGRLIAFAMLVTYNITIQAMPLVGLAVAALIALVMPVLLVKSFRFRLYNTSYRGLRFGFNGSVGKAYKTFLLWPLLTLFSLYLLTPSAHQRIKAYQHSNSRFGQTVFSFDATIGSFYKIYLQVLFFSVAIIGLFVYTNQGLMKTIMMGAGSHNPRAFLIFALTFYGVLIAAGLLIMPFYISRMQNLIWNHTGLGAHRFASTLTARGLLWIIVSNFIGVILTLGLFKPFADVRLARYRVQNMSVLPDSDLEGFIAGAQQQEGATGTETAEMFDVDIAF